MLHVGHRAGERFGKLVLVEEVEGSKPRKWRARCDCGALTILRSGNVGLTKSCGCLKRVGTRTGRPNERHAGERYGRLVLVRRVENNKWGHPMWEALCDCGKTTVVMSTNLGRASKNTESCGCLRAERVRSKQTWEVEFRKALRQRYKLHLSGKPHPWSLTLEQFKALVTADCHYCGAKPSKATKVGGELRAGIDRVDSNRGYEPDNCVPCCTACNLMKGLQSYDEFLARVAQIHRLMSQKAM